MRIRLTLVALMIAASCGLSLRADSVDDAEAKRRGVPVQQVQLEAAQRTIAQLKQEIERLKKQLADARPTTQPTNDPPAKLPVAAVKPTPTPPPATAPASSPPTRAAASPSSSSGVVQVRGYTRRDGTVVAPYTRRTPGGR